MKILTIHSDYLEFEPKQPAGKYAEDAKKIKEKIGECLVVFAAVEREDETKPDEVASNAATEIIKIAQQVKADRIAIYPYAHLSATLADPKTAKSVMSTVETILRQEGLKVHHVPFGWYKSFSISCKGHPLSELSRHITAETVAKRAPIKKEYFVLTEDGKLHNPATYKYKKGEENFRILVEKEALGKESEAKGQPEYIKFMQKFGIDWEGMSDVGHMRFGPLGNIIFELASDYSTDLVHSLGIPIFKVRGTNMFSLNEDAIKEHAQLFGDRLYEVESDKKRFVLRYAACFQQFAVMKDWTISYKHLPLGAFEVADSYRFEQSGELLLCFRCRKLHMPDCHVLAGEMQQAQEWTFKIHQKIYDEVRKLNKDYYSLYNLTSKDFFEKNKDFFIKLVKHEGKPVLLCFYPPGANYYWVLNIEYHIVDAMKRPREIGTVQIDVGNAKRFGIKYTDSSGESKHPIILHTAVVGTIERFLYTVFDSVLQEKNPTLPLWLSPVQVRLCPVNDSFINDCEKLASQLSKRNIRVDIDDRAESVQKKVRDAETDWIPMSIVFGEKEKSADNLPVRFRRTGEVKSTSADDLTELISQQCEGYPFRPLMIPRLLTKRPKF